LHFAYSLADPTLVCSNVLKSAEAASQPDVLPVACRFATRYTVLVEARETENVEA